MEISASDEPKQAGDGLTERNLSAALDSEQRAVLDFWLGDGLLHGWPSRPMNDRWFDADAVLDREIAQRFGALVEEALAKRLNRWDATPLSRLALVLVLDQFPRNIFRGSAKAFAGDGRAQRLVLDALRAGQDIELPWVGRAFLYMPLMHAEDLTLQQQCVECFEQLLAAAPSSLHQMLEGNVRAAKSHRDIIQRFGRFPHRNDALGRTSSAAEQEFLQSGPRFGQ